MPPVKRNLEIAGRLVELPLPGRNRPLDGLWVAGPRRARTLLLLVHGMGSNFYRSPFKKQVLLQGPPRGFDVLSFNNRGFERDVETERFSDCVADIDAAIAFGRAHGYRRFVLLGHSTGCQKSLCWLTRRGARGIDAVVLAAPGDDCAIARRDLGKSYDAWIARARRWVAAGQPTRRLPKKCLGFGARRFLSAADPRQLEARLLHLDGPMREYRALRLPILALLPEREQYACLPVPEMAARLRARTRSRRFGALLVPQAEHSFGPVEAEAVRAMFDWLAAGRGRA